ncbi:hypothetical protein B0H66DRAFT_595334 [Apodospora peruviana]|uniref:2EXR domain-containing protein n=1 Tax=Apodospora peruviana TaxID=516989 RepID=A0AAE0HTV5_9PEZI|nr:hypothetical protein B0H66DRAFT_595334 [Apodospora peruviana]
MNKPESQPVFHFFRRIPPELRRAIWLLCLPRRVVGLNTAPTAEAGTCHFAPTSHRSWAPPVISAVCAESRYIVVENGVNLEKMLADLALPESRRTRWTNFYTSSLGLLWFQSMRDIVHIPLARGPYEKGDPAPMLLRLAVAKAGGRVSIMANVLLGFHDTGFTQAPFSGLEPGIYPAVWELFFRLSHNNSEVNFVLELVNIHIPFCAGRSSGLFGLLGDESVQLVDAMDETAILPFYNLWSTHGHGSKLDRGTANFFMSVLENTPLFMRRVRQWRADITKVWMWHLWLGAHETQKKKGPIRANDLKTDQVWRPPGSWGQGIKRKILQLGIDLLRFELNKDNQWVAGTLAKLPVPRLVIMFRLYGKDCCLGKDAEAKIIEFGSLD